MNIKVENWKLLILSIFYVIFGVISFIIPKEKFISFFQIAGIVLLLIGVFQVLRYFLKKEYMKPDEFSFAFGVLYGIAGMIVAAKPNLIVDNYPIVLSGLVVLDSTLRLQYSMNLFRLEDKQWKVNMGLALVPLVIGMVLILIAFDEKTLHNMFSFLLFLDAIANFYTILYYKRIVKHHGRQSEEILDISKKGNVQKESYDGEDIAV